MAVYTLDELVDGIETVLSAAASLQTGVGGRSQTYDELTEGMNQTPTLQVYPEENLGTDFTGSTDRATLSGKHSFKEYTIIADYYANQRANIGEDMGRLVTGINELEDILDTQTYPLFNLDFVTSFRWSWNRVTFDYGGASFVGARFRLIVRCGTDA
jgi:hypothetical protein